MNSNYSANTDIILTCSVLYLSYSFLDIDVNVTIQWLNSSNHTLHSYTGINNYTEHTINYTINNVLLSDAGEYNCSFSIHTTTPDPYVLPSDTTTAATNVVIVSQYMCISIFTFYILLFALVPNEIESTLSTNPIKSYYEVGSNITLTCPIIHHKSPYIDVSTNVYMHWSHEGNERDFTTISFLNYTEYYFNYTINNLKLSDAGKYTCTYYINTDGYEPYILNSTIIDYDTNITAISKS